VCPHTTSKRRAERIRLFLSLSRSYRAVSPVEEPLARESHGAAWVGFLVRAAIHRKKKRSNPINNKTAGYHSSAIAARRRELESSITRSLSCRVTELWLRAERIRPFCRRSDLIVPFLL
jgi:hypothetical protein